MEEFEFTKRNTDVSNKADVHVKIDNADVGWGFRVKQESAEEKAKRLATQKGKRTVALEEVNEPTVAGLNIDMKMGNMLAVVGQVGCGKTTFL